MRALRCMGGHIGRATLRPLEEDSGIFIAARWTGNSRASSRPMSSSSTSLGSIGEEEATTEESCLLAFEGVNAGRALGGGDPDAGVLVGNAEAGKFETGGGRKVFRGSIRAPRVRLLPLTTTASKPQRSFRTGLPTSSSRAGSDKPETRVRHFPLSRRSLNEGGLDLVDLGFVVELGALPVPTGARARAERGLVGQPPSSVPQHGLVSATDFGYSPIKWPGYLNVRLRGGPDDEDHLILVIGPIGG
ncbi:hypothetical protein FB45DRAFT_1102691 [Roridomyces roridus]|uniref:Uncharacterized protein n=1 Tax=Roridomyces roridus TaxID=1738132 RepID=A0AAD7FXI8_9AGAR|nr:hypothetical protein FB45DRAFT_1102691 [Roridomyces roridus]